MSDDFGSPDGDNKIKNNQSENNSKIGDNSGRVDSLVDNDIGAVTMGNGNQKGIIKRTTHKFMSKGMDLWPSTKKQKIIGAFAALAIIVIGGGAVYALTGLFKTDPDPQQISSQAPKTSEPSKLTGVEVPIETNKRPVTAIMIENSPDARPQAALKDAGVVFEAVAEGGITRFNALFMESEPSYIGPVRSVRPYYIDLFLPFDAAIVHAGGSGQGLQKIKDLHVKDIDHGANAEAFQRISSRYAPHNLYTSMKALDEVNKKRNYSSDHVQSWPRKPEAPTQTPTVTKIDFNLSGDLYNAHFDYDVKSNSYGRSEAGTPHRDDRSGKQIKPKVVIALVMNYSQNGIYSVYKTTGSGKMFVFQDGKVTKGTWKKTGPKNQFTFTDAEGNEIKLNAGQTWVTLVAGTDKVSYK